MLVAAQQELRSTGETGAATKPRALLWRARARHCRRHVPWRLSPTAHHT
eukprot:gene10775-biopygen8381